MTPWELLRRACRAPDEVVIVAPYMKADALQGLLDVIPVTATLTCVTRWTPRDLALGASDIECRALVLGRGGAFLLHPRLHAKYYRCGRHVLIGSANLTASAMGYRASPNVEILCAPGPDFEAVAFEDALMTASMPVSDAEFDHWAAIPRLPLPLTFPEPLSAQENWQPQARDPEHVWFAYMGQLDRIASADERALVQRDLQQLALPTGLSRARFDDWVSACLLASRVVADVRVREPVGDTLAWDELSEAWSVGKQDVARIRETVMYWVRTFLG